MDLPVISPRDRGILRDLARHQAELAAKEENRERMALWYAHNDGQGSRPMLHLELGTFAQSDFLDALDRLLAGIHSDFEFVVRRPGPSSGGCTRISPTRSFLTTTG